MSENKTELVKKELSQSERFVAMVIKEASQMGELNITDFQRKLIQNYFIKLDQVFEAAEIKRLATDEKYRAEVPVIWKNINMKLLALNCVGYSAVDIDALLPNHLSFVPYLNKKTGLYDISFTKGYNGLEIIARRYGLEPPKDVIPELIYKNDLFKEIKKDANNPVEKYIFEIKDSFDRGELRGGFYYQVYEDETKNKLVVFTKAEIDKRKPAKASVEFWGGSKEKREWSKEQKKMVGTGVFEDTEGWYKEMAIKTLKRAGWNNVVIDSKKIDANFQIMKKADLQNVDLQVQNEIEQNANQTTIDISHEETATSPEKLKPAKEEKPMKKKEETKPNEEELKF